VLHSLSPETAAPLIDAYADALGRVFPCAVPVALVGFVVALTLKEVPLRAMDNAPVDLGEGFRVSPGRPDRVAGDLTASFRMASECLSALSAGFAARRQSSRSHC